MCKFHFNNRWLTSDKSSTEQPPPTIPATTNLSKRPATTDTAAPAAKTGHGSKMALKEQTQVVGQVGTPLAKTSLLGLSSSWINNGLHNQAASRLSSVFQDRAQALLATVAIQQQQQQQQATEVYIAAAMQNQAAKSILETALQNQAAAALLDALLLSNTTNPLYGSLMTPSLGAYFDLTNSMTGHQGQIPKGIIDYVSLSLEEQQSNPLLADRTTKPQYSDRDSYFQDAKRPSHFQDELAAKKVRMSTTFHIMNNNLIPGSPPIEIQYKEKYCPFPYCRTADVNASTPADSTMEDAVQGISLVKTSCTAHKNSVFETVIVPSILDWCRPRNNHHDSPSRLHEKIKFVDFLEQGQYQYQGIGWHRREERLARNLDPVADVTTPLEPWERELVWTELLLLTGLEESCDALLAHAWGQGKDRFRSLLIQCFR